MGKEIEKWVEDMKSDVSDMQKKRLTQYFSFQQPKTVLATVYTMSKTQTEITVREIALNTRIPYSTVAAILKEFNNIGLVKKSFNSDAKANIYIGNPKKIEKIIKILIQNGKK